MYIDDCQHTFEELAGTVLSAHMKRLQTALAQMRPASLFAWDKIGPANVARECGLTCDFFGCYVFVEGDRPIYLGISRKVLSRLREHIRGRTHSKASLAYAIALSPSTCLRSGCRVSKFLRSFPTCNERMSRQRFDSLASG